MPRSFADKLDYEARAQVWAKAQGKEAEEVV